MEFTGRIFTFSVLVILLNVASVLLLKDSAVSNRRLVDPVTNQFVYEKDFPIALPLINILGTIGIYAYYDKQKLENSLIKRILTWRQIIEDKDDYDLRLFFNDYRIKLESPLIFKREANHKTWGKVLELSVQNERKEIVNFQVVPYHINFSNPSGEYQRNTKLLAFDSLNPDPSQAHRVLRNVGSAYNIFDKLTELKKYVAELPPEIRGNLSNYIDKMLANEDDSE